MYITKDTLNPEEFFKECRPSSGSGALVTFSGVVRDHHEGRDVEKLIYECYESMAEKMIHRIVNEISNQWPIDNIWVKHRTGELGVGETAVLIAVSSAHRAESFKACEAMIDRIKHKVPIWKKEFYKDGTNQWVLCSHSHEVVGK
jgi:molybdopterin synthase catalytic subunit